MINLIKVCKLNFLFLFKNKNFILYLNVLLTLFTIFSYIRLFYIAKTDKINLLESSHLKLAGYLLLDYYEHCGSLPKNFDNVESFDKCIQAEFDNGNFNDIYNRPIALIKLDRNNYALANFDNNTFSKTHNLLKTPPRPIILDLKNRKVSFYTTENYYLSELFEARRYILTTKKFTPQPSIPE